jgi:hypothetical protein
MRFKNLLGLLAIGGAVAYAQKKRGGDLSLSGIKNSLRGMFDKAKGQLDNMRSHAGAGATGTRTGGRGDVGREYGTEAGTSANIGTSNLGSVGGHDDIAGTTGYSQSAGFGSDGTSTGTGTGMGIGDSGRGRGRIP